MIGWTPVIVLAAVCLPMMALERRGVPTTLALNAKGDVKRETRLLAQYGQLVCTLITSLLILQIDTHRGLQIDKALWTAVVGTTTIAMLLKRLLGRARPRCEDAGRFLGPGWRHANKRESFPSSHSASAMAYSMVLAAAYPHAAATFITLGLICAILRYLMDAHWPSDVLAGIAMGLAGGMLACKIFPVGM